MAGGAASISPPRGARLGPITRVALGFLLGLLFWLVPTDAAAEGAPESIDPEASCASEACHSDLLDHTRLHWDELLAPGQCLECHKARRRKHEFRPFDSSKRCYECHEELRERLASPRGRNQHEPVAKGECSACHDPHGSEEGWLLRAEEGLELCGACHEEIVEGVEGEGTVHEPVEDGCGDCHDPHGARYPGLVNMRNARLCEDCHDEVTALAEESPVDHGALRSKKQCMSCHLPHFSREDALLKKPQRDTCLGCHGEKVESGEEELVDMKHWLQVNTNWHDPIRENGCTDCHEPHGSDRPRLLAKEFPRALYAPFTIEGYGLCFSCHDESMVTARKTRSATKFRNGSRNLHSLHVKRKKRGRTCLACHEVHASRAPLLIRSYVPYGTWAMPLRFEKTERGGSCSSGCHRRRSYDRSRADESK